MQALFSDNIDAALLGQHLRKVQHRWGGCLHADFVPQVYRTPRK